MARRAVCVVQFYAAVWKVLREMCSDKVAVGSVEIEVSPGHIYLAPDLPQTYDYVPWNVVSHVMLAGGLQQASLIDNGANVGDTLAHFRRFSSGPVICVEPASNFFEILQRNVAQFSNVTLVKSLLVPDEMVGKVAFVSGDQTGATRSAERDESVWGGEYVTFTDLFSNSAGPYIVKTDTDGFDALIVKSALPHIQNKNADVPVIFFEGPSEDQMKSGSYKDYTDVCADLIGLGYRLLFLTNIGMPYGCFDSAEAVASAFAALETGYQRGYALCHYYDVIAIREDLVTEEIRLAKPWGEQFFRRD